MDLDVYIFQFGGVGKSFYWSECDKEAACSSFAFYNSGRQTVAGLPRQATAFAFQTRATTMRASVRLLDDEMRITFHREDASEFPTNPILPSFTVDEFTDTSAATQSEVSLHFGSADRVSSEVWGISFTVQRLTVSSCTTISDVEDVVEANEAMITEWGSQEGFARSSIYCNSRSFDIDTPDKSLSLPRYLFQFNGNGSPKYCVVNVDHVSFNAVRDRSGRVFAAPGTPTACLPTTGPHKGPTVEALSFVNSIASYGSAVA